MAKAKPKKSRKKDLKPIAEKLRAEREELNRQLAEFERQSASYAQGEGAGDGSFGEDYADAGSNTFERERDLSLVENLRDLLEKVEHALGRIEDGSYGTCEGCGKTIEAARLKALPYASLCIGCKRLEESRR